VIDHDLDTYSKCCVI